MTRTRAPGGRSRPMSLTWVTRTRNASAELDDDAAAWTWLLEAVMPELYASGVSSAQAGAWIDLMVRTNVLTPDGPTGIATPNARWS